MAITDAYVTATEYRQAIDHQDETDDPVIDAYLEAVSRLVEHRLGPMPSGLNRHFTQGAQARYFEHPGASETVYIDGIVPVGRGTRRLWVDDLVSITSVKVDLNADYDVSDSGETLADGTDFLKGPWNATGGAEPQPYTFLELMTTGSVYAWPTGARSIEVIGTWGWPEVPQAVKQGVIALTKQLRDVSKEPYTLTLENLETRLPLTGGGASILDDIVRHYSQKVFAF